MVIGTIMLIAGIISAAYGIYLNNSVEAQLESLFSNGSVDPGNIWLYLGIAIAVLGLVLIIIGNKKR